MIDYLLPAGHDAKSPLLQTDINLNCYVDKYSHPQFYVVSNVSPMPYRHRGLNYQDRAWMSSYNHLHLHVDVITYPSPIHPDAGFIQPVSRFKFWNPDL